MILIQEMNSPPDGRYGLKQIDVGILAQPVTVQVLDPVFGIQVLTVQAST
jgi:hypothetical protein